MFKDKFYQMFILGTGNLDVALSRNIGGVIFFTRDISSAAQFGTLVEDILSKSKIVPFLSIDQEGGRVERTENLHERFLSPRYAYERGEKFLKSQTRIMLNELMGFGINMNYSPCLDVNSNPLNPIIGERAFSDNAEDVCKGFDIVNGVYDEVGIIPVVKHFPGHGDAGKDSHLELPRIELGMDKMESVHIKPFRHAVGCGVGAVMVAHLHCLCFDKECKPTSLSQNCIDYLRKDVGFEGVVISDDMFMNGVKSFGDMESCLMGIESGINMFIYRESSDEVLDLLERVYDVVRADMGLRLKVEDSYERILGLKQRYGLLD